jgi:FtsH-binding integral membrane protein
VAEKQKGKGEHMFVLFVFAVVILIVGFVGGKWCREGFSRPTSRKTRIVLRFVVGVLWFATLAVITPTNGVSVRWQYFGIAVASFVCGAFFGIMTNPQK